MKCGCKVVFIESAPYLDDGPTIVDRTIEFCSLHAAAEELQIAAQVHLAYCERTGLERSHTVNALREALAHTGVR